VQNDRARDIGGDLAFGLPQDLPALLGIDLARLREDQLVHLLVAVARVVAVGLAGVVLDQVHVRIVDADTGGVETDCVVLALHLGVPDGGVYDVELALDVDLLHLVDEDYRGIPVKRMLRVDIFTLSGLAAL